MRIARRTLSLALLSAALAPRAFAQAPAPGAPDDPRPRTYELLGQRAQAFAFPLLGGGEARLSAYRGRTLILYFGGLWCPDCVADGANINALARRANASSDIAFLNIHTRNRFGRWGGDDQSALTPAQAQAAIGAYFAETGFAYPVAFDASRDWARTHYAIAWYPSFLIVDGAGIIRAWRTDLGAAGADAFYAQAQMLAASA